MATTYMSSSSTISSIVGFCLVSEARVGGNGNPNGTPELDLGSGPSSLSYGRITWTPDTSNGFDSGIVNVTLDIEPGTGGNTASWDVAGANPEPILYGGVRYGAISQVLVRAAVQNTAAMLWRNVQVAFYKAGTKTDGVILRSGPHVDTTGGGGSTTAEQILTVIPAANNNDKVIVTGQIELSAPAGVVLAANDIFGQIFVLTSSCVSA